MKMLIINKKKYFKVFFVLLIISVLSIGGCSNNRNSELAQQLKKDGYYVVDYTKGDEDIKGSYVLMNYTKDNYYEKRKTVGDGIAIVVNFFEDSKGLSNVVFSDAAYDEQRLDYCVYGSTGDCFPSALHPDGEQKKEIDAQPKMKKVFNKFLKKYDMTKEEFMDLLQYIYENEGKLE